MIGLLTMGALFVGALAGSIMMPLFLPLFLGLASGIAIGLEKLKELHHNNFKD